MNGKVRHLNFVFMKETQIARLDRERKNLNWNWAEFARRVGESPQAIQNWKKRGRIPAEKHAKVAHTFGKSIEWLQTGVDRSSAAAIDPRRLTDVLEAIEMNLPREKYYISPSDMAKLIIDLYEAIPGSGELSSATVIQFVRPVRDRAEGAHGRVTKKTSTTTPDRGRIKKRQSN
jgi:transcriptional regulator with XRE-family HTH domain